MGSLSSSFAARAQQQQTFMRSKSFATGKEARRFESQRCMYGVANRPSLRCYFAAVAAVAAAAAAAFLAANRALASSALLATFLVVVSWAETTDRALA